MRSRRLRHSGIALIVVVGVLALILVLGVIFNRSMNLNFRSAVAARDVEESAIVAETGVHQAMAFLQYDVWGVNEKEAFACAAAQGRLRRENGADFTDEDLPQMDGSVAFYIATPAAYRRITQQVSKWRRPLVRVPINPGSQQSQHRPVCAQSTRGGETDVRAVENDLSWVVNSSAEYKRFGAPQELMLLPGHGSADPPDRVCILSGAPLHDEFLPGPFDNHDLWEYRTHANRAMPEGVHFGGRDSGSDFLRNGGQWQDNGWGGHYWAWPAMRRFEEFDYIDTRVCGDAFYRLFRYDLVADESGGAGAFLSFEGGVDPYATGRNGVAIFPAASPRRYLHDKESATDVHPQNAQNRLWYTHLGQVGRGPYEDSRGNAINLNQVNNNSVSERYTDRTGRRYFYNEAKWIYVYNPDGSHGNYLKRYAVTIVPQGGLPNANFSGPPENDDLATPLDESARTWGLPWYLRAIDTGFTLRGGPAEQDALAALKGEFPRADWANTASANIARHVRGRDAEKGHGPIASRAELHLLLRKCAFDGPGATEELRSAAASFLCDKFSVHGYEYQLDAHWSADRLVIDRGDTPEHTSSFYNERAPNAADGVATRRRLAEILNFTQFALGPDDEREGTATPFCYSTRDNEAARAQAAWSKAGSMAHLLSANLDPAHLGQWTSPGFPAWWQATDGANTRNLNLDLLDRKPNYSAGIHADSYLLKERVKPEDVQYQEEAGWNGTHGWAMRISEIGSVQPRKFDELPVATTETHRLPGETSWTFDGEKTYWFIELVANFSAMDAPVRQRIMDDFAGSWQRHWQLLVMNPDGSSAANCDVLKLPGTRVITVDLAADPAVLENSGGDADTTDPRLDLAGINRIKVFNPAVGSGGANGVDAKNMLRPSVATFNRLMWRWRNDTPSPLSMRDVRGESEDGSRREIAWRESFARAHPANYMLVLFDPEELPPDTRGQQIRWCCQRLNTRTDTILLNAVDLPRDSRPFEEGWEAVDLRNNRDGRMAWRRARAFAAPEDGGAYVPLQAALPHLPVKTLNNAGVVASAFAKFTGSPAFRFFTKGEGRYYNWCDGLNEHAIGHFAPGGEKNFAGAGVQSFSRGDVEDHGGARAWNFACGNEETGVLDKYGTSRGMMQFLSDMSKVPLNWFSLTTPANGTTDKIPDPDLRTWGDLMRVTPLEQAVTFGYLRGEGWGEPLSESMYWLYPANDGLDNDQDGRVDRMTPEPSRADGPAGHYQSDRRSAGRVNLNEVSDPAVLWYAGLGLGPLPDGTQPQQNLATVLGRKPHKGYVSWRDIETRLNLQCDPETPYNALIWPDNLHADLAVRHAHHQDQYENLSQKRMSMARTLTVSHSPVYAVYCTAQTIDRTGEVRSQTRIRVVVERTCEGRMNILEWAPIEER